MAVFSDIPLYPSPAYTEGMESIQGSLEMLFLYNPGEDFTNPKFGCEIEELLFELIDEITEKRILIALTECVSYWEPRVQVTANSTITGDPDNYKYDVYLVLEVVATGEKFAFETILRAPKSQT